MDTNPFLAQAYEQQLRSSTAQITALTAKVLELNAHLERAANKIAELNEEIARLESRDSGEDVEDAANA